MEFNSIQKYQKYKNKYINLKNTNKINNITYFKQHGSGLFDECRNSGIYMIVGDDKLNTIYTNKVNPMTNNVIGIRKDMTSCEFFNEFKGFYKLKSDSDTLIEIKEKKQDIITDASVVGVAAVVAGKEAAPAPAAAVVGKEAAGKANKLKLTSSYNFKDFIDNLNTDEITNTPANKIQKLLLDDKFYRNFCKLLKNIKEVFEKLSNQNLLKYTTYRDSKKDPTKTQKFLNFFNSSKKPDSESSSESLNLDSTTDIMDLENIYNYFKDSEINNYVSPPTFTHYFFIEFSITTSKIINIGGIKEIETATGLPKHVDKSKAL
jgi:hypothetical protein